MAFVFIASASVAEIVRAFTRPFWSAAVHFFGSIAGVFDLESIAMTTVRIQLIGYFAYLIDLSGMGWCEGKKSTQNQDEKTPNDTCSKNGFGGNAIE
jgi:hypothetical protein